MASTLPGATQIERQGGVADSDRIEVAWLGTRPSWVDRQVTFPVLDGFSITSAVTPDTRVVHLGRQARASVAGIRESHSGTRIVVDLGAVSGASGNALVDAARADIALVESELAAHGARARAPELEGRLRVVPDAVDLTRYAPEAMLTKLIGARIKRFRRLHRLADPTLLFVGPYTPAGGLDVAIAAAYRLREQFEDIRLAAIPLGAVDQKYLDRCEMDALALGHRGIVEWTCSDDDRPFWYATATVVCCPWREPETATPEAPVLAAAAARPFVGSDLGVFRDSFRVPSAPALIRRDDVDALVDSVTPLLADLARTSELGEAARSAVEEVFSYEAAAGRLASLWSSLAEQSPLDEAA